jgi:hypothetical protein
MPIGFTTTIWIIGKDGSVMQEHLDFTLTTNWMYGVESAKMIS